MPLKRYRINMRNGQSFIVNAHNEDEAWDTARYRIAKYLRKQPGALRKTTPAQHVASIEADV